MRWIALIFALAGTALAQPVEPTPTPPVDLKIELKVSLVGERHEFHMGEIIPIKLRFSSRVKSRYRLNEAQYDRSGRMDYEHFIIKPEEGAVDPLARYFAEDIHMGGGLTNFEFLNSKPWVIKLNLNEWVRFTKPGDYKLTVSSQRVEVVDPSSSHGMSPITAMSNEITIKIHPVDFAWQKRMFDEAIKTLKTSAPVKPEEKEKSPVYHALEVLRFLETPDATRELANQLRGERRGDFTCYIGLVSSPERAIALEALKQAIADPDCPVDDTLLDALSVVESHNAGHEAGPKDRQKTLEELVRILPDKRNKALSASLSTAVTQILSGASSVSQQTMQKLINQLVSIFDQLPLGEQSRLLTFYWDKIKSPTLLPLLKRYAQNSPDYSVLSAEDRYNLREIICASLKHWYELDPAGARPAIINEIVRLNPRFSSREIGFLPDTTLSEADKPLVDHLMAAKDFDNSINVALLIGRYATGAILPQVIEQLDRHLGKTTCDVQNPLLAYVLRIDPELARPRIEKAIAARGKTFTGCYRRIFSEISTIHYDPVLEQIAMRALDDPDTEVAIDAAGMLGRYGSPTAESALWRCYESWSKRWAGHESELSLAYLKDVVGGKADQLAFGRSLFEELAKGQGWLTDQTKLQRLAGIANIPIITQELDRYLKAWKERPLTLSVDSCEPRFDAGVAQYHIDSLEKLKEKLKQFPKGTAFILSSPPDEADRQCIANIRDFVTSEGMSIARESRRTQ